jgi:hypothetical protein
LRFRTFLQVLSCLVALNAVAQNPPGFTFLEAKGPYAVGLRVVEQYDYSRSFQPSIENSGDAEHARPLQTLIWYPADRNNERPMIYSDYVSLEKTETSFGHPQVITGMEARHLASMLPSTLSQTMWAIRDARPVTQRFPLVVYAPSFSLVSWENADLCEYLASYGYVVVAAPAMGVGRESTHDVSGTNAQARDISFLIEYARSLTDVDLTKTAVVGYSWGGIANLFAAARDSRIDALVALDGSIDFDTLIWPHSIL